MLTGRELGEAIRQAIELKLESGKAKSKAEIARHFGVRPPSIHDWMKKGSISKDKLPELFRYFSDVVGPEHWGLSGEFGQEPPPGGEVAPVPERDDSIDLSHLTDSQRRLYRTLLESLPSIDDQSANALITLIERSQGGKPHT